MSRGRYSSGEQTRIRLIETAERLFARRGYDVVTLADIRKAAGQHNSSVIGYYFGTKDGLLDAVVGHRFPAVDADRGGLMRELLRPDDTLSTRDALWVVTLPLAHTLGRNNHYVALLHRLIADGQFTRHVGVAMATENGRAADLALRASVTHLPPDMADQRLEFVYAGVVRALSRCRSTPPERAELSSLIDVWEAALAAPISKETVAALAAR